MGFHAFEVPFRNRIDEEKMVFFMNETFRIDNKIRTLASIGKKIPPKNVASKLEGGGGGGRA